VVILTEQGTLNQPVEQPLLVNQVMGRNLVARGRTGWVAHRVS
jgi:hypothetical protein